MQKALIESIIIGILLGLYSFFIYYFRLVFLGVGVAHAIFGGLALGYVLGVNPFLMAYPFSVVVGLLIAFLKQHSKISEDASVGIVLSMSMAFGIIIIYLFGNKNQVLPYLFGSILSISWGDILFSLVLLLLSILFFYFNFRKLLYMCFDQETAYSSGVKINFLYYVFIILSALVIVLSARVIGVILSHAMIVLPASISIQFLWNYLGIFSLSLFFGILVMILGLALSYFLNVPVGAAIVAVGSLFFIISSFYKKLFRE